MSTVIGWPHLRSGDPLPRSRGRRRSLPERELREPPSGPAGPAPSRPPPPRQGAAVASLFNELRSARDERGVAPDASDGALLVVARARTTDPAELGELLR